MDTLALELNAQDKYDEAEPLYSEALLVRREALGDRHPSTLISIGDLGGLLMDKGDLGTADHNLCNISRPVNRPSRA